MKKGRIVKSLSGFYYVYSDGEIYETRGRGVFRKQNITPLVGDFVQFEVSGEKEGYILKIEKRMNELIRPPIANIHQAIIVVSAKKPDFSSLLLNRFLVKVESKGIKPIIVITKMDLVTKKEREILNRYKNIYEKIGYEVIFFEKEGCIEELLPHIKNKVSVVSGQTGVGKSTLLNTIKPELNLETGDISKVLGRGKHTTRHVELIKIADGLVADTPGFSTIEFENIEKEQLTNYFPEMKRNKVNCKFRECLHYKEPQCAIKKAVEENKIEQFRYDHYLKFLNEITLRKPRYS